MFKVDDYVKLIKGSKEIDLKNGTEGYINEVDNGLVLFQPIYSDVEEYWINENNCELIERL